MIHALALAFIYPPPSISVKDDRFFPCADAAIDIFEHT